MKIFTRFTIIIFLCFLIGIEKSTASHVAGGEITWSCVGNGQYVFKITIYRNCDGITVMTSSIPLKHDFPGIPDIDCNLTSISDVSPSCASATNRLNCGSDLTSMSGLVGSVTRYTFQSFPISLVGVPAPPSSGYIIYANTECCRSNDITNFDFISEQTLRAKMYGFIAIGNTTPNVLSICFDNSPNFSETPNLVTYQYNKEYSLSYNAIDKDNDDLSYSFDYPLMAGITDTAFFSPGYSITKPIARMNVKGLNSKTGELAFTPAVSGKFLTVIKVSSRKCGQVVSEIYRDITLSVLSDPNPTITTQNVLPTILPIFNNKSNSNFDTTMVAGDTLLFKISVADLTNSGIPSLQGMKVYVNGLGMGAENKSLNLCPFPPCAILNKDNNVNSGSISAQPQLITNEINNVAGDTLGYGFSIQPTTLNPKSDFYFYWPTSCSNLNYVGLCPADNKKTYNFLITAKDDYCLAPGKDVKTISVTLTSSNFSCLSSTNQINRSFTLALSPNPANDKINWVIPNPANSKTYLEVYSITGQLLVYEITNDNFLEIKNFDSGMYFLKMKNGDNFYSGKFVKN